MTELPLLDTCDPRPLLDAVARSRAWQSHLVGEPVVPAECLQPERARYVFARRYSEAVDRDPYAAGACELSSTQQRALEAARGVVLSVMPHWVIFDALPTRVLVTPHQGILSYSCLIYPQHIFLGAVPLSHGGQELLIENYLHEYAHIWLYLSQELFPFSANRHCFQYTLPSGTPGRSVTAVIDAAYVAAVLRRYYATMGQRLRVMQLTAYLAGCLMQIRNDPDLTSVGLKVCRRLAVEVTRTF